MTRSRTGRLFVTALAGALAVSTAACGSGSGGAESGDGKVRIAASTNVWGSVAGAVGGDQVDVKTIIDDPGGDPHSYEASPEDAVDVQDAQVVVYNGGGYDDFVTKLAEQAPDARQIVAFDLSGKGGEHEDGAAEDSAHEEGAHEEGAHEDGNHEEGAHEEGTHEDGNHDHEGHDHEGHSHDHGDVNEHVWYDLPTVAKVAEQVAAQLGELRPEAKQAFADNAAAFTAGIDELVAKAAKIGTDGPGTKIIATEPVAHYLLEAAKAEDVTPPEFSKAIEEERDVSVAAQDAVNQLVEGRQVQAVVHNPQTSTPVTEQLVAKAKAAGLPVVDVTETLPAGEGDYIAWMTKEVDALAGALSGR